MNNVHPFSISDRYHKKTDAIGLAYYSRLDHHGTKDVRINVLEFIKLPPQSNKPWN